MEEDKELYGELEYSAPHLILQYLSEKGFHQTLEIFQQECGITYHASAVKFGGHLETILFEQKELNLTQQLGEVGLEEKSKERQGQEFLLERGQGDFANSLYKTLEGLHSQNILSTAFSRSPERNWIASGSSDKTMCITDYETGEEVLRLLPHQGAVLSLDWNPNPALHHLLLSSAMDGSVSVTDTNTGKVLFNNKCHNKYVVYCRWYSDGITFATASHDHTVAVFRCANPADLQSNAQSPQPNLFTLIQRFPFNSNAENLVWTKEGTLIVAAREDNYLHLLDMNSTQRTKFNMNAAMDDHVSFTAMSLSLNPSNEDYLLVGTDRDRVILYNIGNSTPVRNFWGAPNDLYANPKNCWHHSGKYVYSNAQDKKIYCWEVSNSTVVEKLEGHHGVVRDLQHHPTKNLLATASFDKTVKLWSVNNNNNNNNNS